MRRRHLYAGMSVSGAPMEEACSEGVPMMEGRYRIPDIRQLIIFY